MKDYLNDIYVNYPVRRSRSEKETFRKYVLDEVAASGRTACVEAQKKQNNIVIGDVERAKLIFTAHYDTPATSVVPNFMLPKNKYLGRLLHFILPTVLSVSAYVIGNMLADLITQTRSVNIFLTIFFWFSLFGLLFFLLELCFPNQHNKNDNTSGVATVLSLAQDCSSEDVAFVLFDNEEKGYLGSKAFKKKYGEHLKDKLIINFDCVGVGDHVLCVVKEGARNHRLYGSLVEHMKSSDRFQVLFYPYGEATANSDYKIFPCGVGVMTCKKKKGIFYAGKIHTNADSEAYTENVEFLVNNMVRFVMACSGENTP